VNREKSENGALTATKFKIAFRSGGGLLTVVKNGGRGATLD